jgi:cytochrome P450
MHPEVQRKAQDELETVVGQERIPSFEDLERLPYLQAVVKELSRWHTVLPYGEYMHRSSSSELAGTHLSLAGVPHTATEDDMLNGYRIPAGTLIFTNNW